MTVSFRSYIRRTASSLSYEEFIEMYALPGRPVVIRGGVELCFRGGLVWNREHLTENMGQKVRRCGMMFSAFLFRYFGRKHAFMHTWGSAERMSGRSLFLIPTHSEKQAASIPRTNIASLPLKPITTYRRNLVAAGMQQHYRRSTYLCVRFGGAQPS